MSKYLLLQVRKPCHESWNEMDKADKGRFCLACQKKVIDFSVMIDQEISQYISRTKGNFCGRYSTDQLNREIHIRKARELGWMKYFIHVMIPAFILANRSLAQEKIKSEVAMIRSESLRNNLDSIVSINYPEKKYTIRGVVMDEYGNPINGASVVIVGTNRGTATDSNGNFQIIGKNSSKVFLKASCVGFEHAIVAYDCETNQSRSLVITIKPFTTLGLTEVIYTRVKKKSDTSLVKKIKNWFENSNSNDTVKIYPNPVSPGTVMNLQFDMQKNGEYLVMVMNASGLPAMQKKLIITNPISVEQINISKEMTSGNYIVEVLNLSTRKIFSTRLLVL